MVKKDGLSLTNRAWEIWEEKICKNPSEIVDVILKNRGINDLEAFRNISLGNTMPDPLSFVDMKKAVNLIVEAIESGKKIAIFGDYDVDGISSTVLFMKFFDYLGVPFVYSMPNRMEDGYGLSVSSLARYKNCLVIAVDCGSSAFSELEYALNNNMDVIVIDHHAMESIPQAAAVVNPYRPDEKNGYKYLCAAGMVFMCIAGVNRLLCENGFYEKKQLRKPSIIDYLDLVALATVCDVMPLIELNRAFVLGGMKIMREKKNFGINALMSKDEISEISSDTIAYLFGPKINAAGRLASADLSIRLLSTKDQNEARRIAWRLDELNKKRKELEKKTVEEALQQVDENLDFICVHSEKWHAGIIGIVAGRLKEMYHKPSIVISIDKCGKGKGSCRSIAEVDISSVIKKAIREGIVSSGGGHAAAAGFYIDEIKINSLMEFFKSEIKYQKIQNKLYADCFIPASVLSLDMAKAVSSVGPFGNGNKHPKFVIPNLKISQAAIIGQNHIRLLLKDEEERASFNAIAFRSKGTPLGEAILKYRGSIQVLGSLSTFERNGKFFLNFILDDIAKNDVLETQD